MDFSFLYFDMSMFFKTGTVSCTTSRFCLSVRFCKCTAVRKTITWPNELGCNWFHTTNKSSYDTVSKNRFAKRTCICELWSKTEMWTSLVDWSTGYNRTCQKSRLPLITNLLLLHRLRRIILVICAYCAIGLQAVNEP